MRKKEKQDKKSVSRSLHTIFLSSMGQLAAICFVLVCFIIIITALNRQVFNRYGTGQGKAGTVELKFSALHEDVRYLVFETRKGEQEEDMAEIEGTYEELVGSVHALHDILQGKENEELYVSVAALIEDYSDIMGQIIEYEKQGGKYNSEKLYNNEASALAREMKGLMEQLFYNMNASAGHYYKMFAAESILAVIAVIGLSIFILIYSLKKSGKAIRDICLPLEELTICSEEIAKGNLHVSIKNNGDGEIGSLAKSLAETVKSLNTYIEDISGKLGHIADHDLTDEITLEYEGDFEPIGKSLIEILQSLNDIFARIDVASDEVYAGASQVADGAQNLAQGTLVQSGLIDRIRAEVKNISGKADINRGLCEKAGIVTQQTKVFAEDGKKKVEELIVSMKTIDNTSDKISKILQSINDIAGQTNLLALNAGIEAARAGEAGKGFAVVAGEVSRLADRCAAAAKETAGMITETREAVERGNEETRKAGESILKMLENIADIDSSVKEIGERTGEQGNAIGEITDKMEDIIRIVNDNSSTAEESAAASEQLFVQAELLKNTLKGIERKSDVTVHSVLGNA